MRQVKMGNGTFRWWPSIEEVMEADEEGTGFCASCGAAGQQAEPDAEGYECDECESESVYGAAEFGLRGWVS